MADYAKLTVNACLLLVGIIHLLPVSGALGAAQVAKLYGVAIDGPDFAILLRHRAVLFGLLGSLMIYAVFRDDVQWLALVAGFVSVGTFVLFALGTPGHSAEIGRVFAVDIAALGLLAAAAAARAVSLLKG